MAVTLLLTQGQFLPCNKANFFNTDFAQNLERNPSGKPPPFLPSVPHMIKLLGLSLSLLLRTTFRTTNL